jgi:hypothetical protein
MGTEPDWQRDPELLTGGGVTWNFLDVLGVEPAIGRDFVRSMMTRVAAPVVITHPMASGAAASAPTETSSARRSS